MKHDFIDELRWRGLFHQCTDEAGLHAHLASGTRRAYCGFDPTADSLTIGNLVPIVLLRHWQLAGHAPVVVVGGGTGLIGDPSGKSAERQLMTEERVRANVEAQQKIFARVLEFSGPRAAVMTNNLDWLGKIGFIAALRDIGKHFSINEMIKRDSVRERLENREQGISYTEFSYMLLQAYDFLHLYRTMGVTAQVSGSDQWGNIVPGIDLIKKTGFELFLKVQHAGSDLAWELEHGDRNSEKCRLLQSEYDKVQREYNSAGGWQPPSPEEIERIRTEALNRPIDPNSRFSPEMQRAFSSIAGWYEIRASWQSFGLTAPLVTKADGTKFGKTESGAIWLSPERTSPYAFYQFWLNASDADAGKWVRFFTFLPREEVEALEKAHTAEPGKREAHRALARHMTAMLHGESAMREAEAAAQALFSGDVAGLPLTILNEVFASVPSSEHKRDELAAGVPLVDLLPLTTLCKSKREAREHLTAGAVTVNGRPVGPEDRLTADMLLHGSIAAIRRGKKAWHVTRWIG